MEAQFWWGLWAPSACALPAVFAKLQPAAGYPDMPPSIIAVLATNVRLSDIGIARWRGTMLALFWHRRKLSEETIDG
jgi:hypothetical protein